MLVGRRIDNRRRCRRDDTQFSNFFFVFFKALTNFIPGQITAMFGPYILMLRCELLNENDERNYQWKAWCRSFRSSIQEIRVEFIINNRRIIIVAEVFVKESWILRTRTLTQNQVSPSDGMLCRNCTKPANCRIDSCHHFICLECAYILKEMVINNCTCQIRITTAITHFTTQNQFKLEESTITPIRQLTALMTLFLIPATNKFTDRTPLREQFGAFELNIRWQPLHNYNLRRRRGYVLIIVFSYYLFKKKYFSFLIMFRSTVVRAKTIGQYTQTFFGKSVTYYQRSNIIVCIQITNKDCAYWEIRKVKHNRLCNTSMCLTCYEYGDCKKKPCNHIYCYRCILGFVEHNKVTCQYCRKRIQFVEHYV